MEEDEMEEKMAAPTVEIKAGPARCTGAYFEG